MPLIPALKRQASRSPSTKLAWSTWFQNSQNYTGKKKQSQKSCEKIIGKISAQLSVDKQEKMCTCWADQGVDHVGLCYIHIHPSRFFLIL